MQQTKRENGRFWLALVIFSLVGQIAWVVENMYFNVFIYKMFAANEKQIALMVTLSAVAATVTTILIGALSDKLGKRKIFICGGYIVWGITILCFAFIRVDFISAVFPYASATALGISLVIIFDCLVTFFGSSANDACFNAWLTDMTDNKNRGKVEGINAMMPLMAILVVFGGFMSLDQSKSSSWTLIFSVIGGIVILIGVLGIFLIKDSRVETSENKKYFSNIVYGFRPSVVKQNKMLYASLASYAVFGISIQIFMPYLIIFYSETLGMENYVFIMAPAIILAAVFTFFYGRIYDKKGFDKTIFPSVGLLILGYVILFAFGREGMMETMMGTPLVFIGSLLMMCGYLSGMAVFGAVIRDYTPENKSGMLQGMRIVAQVLIPGAIGPQIGSMVLKGAKQIVNDDGTKSFLPNEKIFMAALIVAIVLVAILAVICCLRKKGAKKSVENNNE